MSDYIKQNGTMNKYSNDDTWSIVNNTDKCILEKINSNGKKLLEWGVSINYGIKTGYNEAFIIDEATKNIILASDPKCGQLIRPILRGRDIDRYKYNFSNQYIIYIPWHFPLNPHTTKGASIEAEKLFKKQYPTVYEYLLKHKDKLSNRNKAETCIRYEWYALQRWGSNYSDDFYEQNIAWQRITKKNIFCLTEKDMVILDSMAFISHLGKYKYYLLAVLNSDIMHYWIKLNVPAYGNSGYRLSNQFVVNMPIPIPNEKQLHIIEKWVKGKLSDNCNNSDDDNYLLTLIAELYDLSENETNYIKNYIRI